MAPEQLNGEINKIEYTYKVDNWALGCIIYELCTLHQCFSSFDNLLEARYAPIDAKFHGFFIQELINSLLKKESSERADIKDI
jgi:serine/threonine protein kinase